MAMRHQRRISFDDEPPIIVMTPTNNLSVVSAGADGAGPRPSPPTTARPTTAHTFDHEPNLNYFYAAARSGEVDDAADLIDKYSPPRRSSRGLPAGQEVGRHNVSVSSSQRNFYEQQQQQQSYAYTNANGSGSFYPTSSHHKFQQSHFIIEPNTPLVAASRRPREQQDLPIRRQPQARHQLLGALNSSASSASGASRSVSQHQRHQDGVGAVATRSELSSAANHTFEDASRWDQPLSARSGSTGPSSMKQLSANLEVRTTRAAELRKLQQQKQPRSASPFDMMVDGHRQSIISRSSSTESKIQPRSTPSVGIVKSSAPGTGTGGKRAAKSPTPRKWSNDHPTPAEDRFDIPPAVAIRTQPPVSPTASSFSIGKPPPSPYKRSTTPVPAKHHDNRDSAAKADGKNLSGSMSMYDEIDTDGQTQAHVGARGASPPRSAKSPTSPRLAVIRPAEDGVPSPSRSPSAVSARPPTPQHQRGMPEAKGFGGGAITNKEMQAKEALASAPQSAVPTPSVSIILKPSSTTTGAKAHPLYGSAPQHSLLHDAVAQVAAEEGLLVSADIKTSRAVGPEAGRIGTLNAAGNVAQNTSTFMLYKQLGRHQRFAHLYSKLGLNETLSPSEAATNTSHGGVSAHSCSSTQCVYDRRVILERIELEGKLKTMTALLEGLSGELLRYKEMYERSEGRREEVVQMAATEARRKVEDRASRTSATQTFQRTKAVVDTVDQGAQATLFNPTADAADIILGYEEVEIAANRGSSKASTVRRPITVKDAIESKLAAMEAAMHVPKRTTETQTDYLPLNDASLKAPGLSPDRDSYDDHKPRGQVVERKLDDKQRAYHSRNTADAPNAVNYYNRSADASLLQIREDDSSFATMLNDHSGTQRPSQARQRPEGSPTFADRASMETEATTNGGSPSNRQAFFDLSHAALASMRSQMGEQTALLQVLRSELVAAMEERDSLRAVVEDMGDRMRQGSISNSQHSPLPIVNHNNVSGGSTYSPRGGRLAADSSVFHVSRLTNREDDTTGGRPNQTVVLSPPTPQENEEGGYDIAANNELSDGKKLASNRHVQEEGRLGSPPPISEAVARALRYAAASSPKYNHHPPVQQQSPEAQVIASTSILSTSTITPQPTAAGSINSSKAHAADVTSISIASDRSPARSSRQSPSKVKESDEDAVTPLAGAQDTHPTGSGNIRVVVRTVAASGATSTHLQISSSSKAAAVSTSPDVRTHQSATGGGYGLTSEASPAPSSIGGRSNSTSPCIPAKKIGGAQSSLSPYLDEGEDEVSSAKKTSPSRRLQSQTEEGESIEELQERLAEARNATKELCKCLLEKEKQFATVLRLQEEREGSSLTPGKGAEANSGTSAASSPQRQRFRDEMMERVEKGAVMGNAASRLAQSLRTQPHLVPTPIPLFEKGKSVYKDEDRQATESTRSTTAPSVVKGLEDPRSHVQGKPKSPNTSVQQAYSSGTSASGLNQSHVGGASTAANSANTSEISSLVSKVRSNGAGSLSQQQTGNANTSQHQQHASSSASTAKKVSHHSLLREYLKATPTAQQ